MEVSLLLRRRESGLRVHTEMSETARSPGDRALAGKRRKARGSRKRRWVARIWRGSHTPAYAVQTWNRAAAAAQPPTAQPTGPASRLS